MTAFTQNSCEALAATLSELFVCSQQGEYTRIRTPYLYPDGDVIDLYIKPSANGKGATITDLGETVRWLRGNTLAARRSPKQTQIIQDICTTHGIEFFKGMLLARYGDEAQLADVSTRVAQAAIRVADIWFSFRNKAFESVSDEVEDFLKEQEIPYVRSPKIPGRSGRIWTPTFQTRTQEASSLVYVLSTGSRSAARGVAEHVLAAWYDLSHIQTQQNPSKFVSLFDDTVDVWAQEDFQLVNEISRIARWSEPEEVSQILKPAA